MEYNSCVMTKYIYAASLLMFYKFNELSEHLVAGFTLHCINNVSLSDTDLWW